MLKSMTGFGIANTETDKSKITIEIKSLNSKFLELFVKLPKRYSDKELALRMECSKLIERGKVNVIISVEYFNEADQANVTINQELLKRYYTQLLDGANILNANTSDLFSIALNMPNVMKPEQSIDESEWKIIIKTFLEATKVFNQFREQEGAVLKKDLISRAETILVKLSEVEGYEAGRIEVVRERLDKCLQSAVGAENIDNNRLEQELIYYIEKFDITEEKVRLRSHCDFFMENLNSSDSNGKKLGFICQEMGREVNTIGSKANDANMQKIVVIMKDELEKIKEQLLNVQ